MVQETGETRDAIIEDDNKQIQAILEANKHRREKYWIVVAAKPSRSNVDGMPTLVKHIKPYSVRPASLVGMIIGAVDPLKETLEWEVNMPQAPFDVDRLPGIKSSHKENVVVETTSIPGAYVTQ